MDAYGLLGLGIIIIVLFFIFREVFLWYWKINKIVEKLDSLVAELKKITANTQKE